MSVELREAAAGELSTVESLLERYGLPTADLRDGAATVYLASVDGSVVGVGGLEAHGDAGLLRSVAVDERGEGHGSAICDRLEARAASSGIGTLYLLTETAAGFFEGRGYERIDREAAPAAIRATAEFDELCGDTAVAMRKRL
ncbi:MAG: arsenic resistance N-acetyltransferase ArsN2 [Halobacteriales archaeon]|nr:arsenic resistance N-acetyltransferase ArsN2 [Halobacteriales archaeon]